MIAKNWTLDAALEIWNKQEARGFSVEWVRHVLAKHMPFKPDTAYMPVPRCDQCRYWDQESDITSSEPGECRLEANVFTPKMAIITNDDPSGVYLLTHPDFGCVQWEAKL